MEPSAATRVASRAQPRVHDLLHALAAKGVDSRARLAAAWRGDPGFLRRELAAWLGNAGARLLVATWPRLLEEAGEAAGTCRGGGKGRKEGKLAINKERGEERGERRGSGKKRDRMGEEKERRRGEREGERGEKLRGFREEREGR